MSRLPAAQCWACHLLTSLYRFLVPVFEGHSMFFGKAKKRTFGLLVAILNRVFDDLDGELS